MHRSTLIPLCPAPAIAVCIALAIIAAGRPASAGEAESDTYFAQGRELRKAGKCDEAIPVFRRALETYPEGLGAIRNIAECEEELGRFASARRSWADLRLGVLESTKAKYAGWDKTAEQARARLDAKVPRITIRLKGSTTTAQVYVNGRPLDPRLLGTAVEEDVGPIEVTLRNGGKIEQTKSLVLEEGKQAQVELEAPPDERAQPVQPEPSTPHPIAPAKGSVDGLLVAGGVTLGLGVAALAGFGIALGIEESARGDVEDKCPALDTAPCHLRGDAANEAQDAKARGQAAATAVNVLSIVGGLGVAAGASLLVASAVRSGSAKSRAGIELDAGPIIGGGASFWIRGRF